MKLLAIFSCLMAVSPGGSVVYNKHLRPSHTPYVAFKRGSVNAPETRSVVYNKNLRPSHTPYVAFKRESVSSPETRSVVYNKHLRPSHTPYVAFKRESVSAPETRSVVYNKHLRPSHTPYVAFKRESVSAPETRSVVYNKHLRPSHTPYVAFKRESVSAPETRSVVYNKNLRPSHTPYVRQSVPAPETRSVVYNKHLRPSHTPYVRQSVPAPETRSVVYNKHLRPSHTPYVRQSVPAPETRSVVYNKNLRPSHTPYVRQSVPAPETRSLVYNNNLRPSHTPYGVSKRESEPATEPVQPPETLFELINQTLENATGGIRGEDLKAAAQTFQFLAAVSLESAGANVSREDVKSLITEITAELGTRYDATDILNDPLTAQAKDVDTELRLLQKLRERGLSSEGESQNVVLAAILTISQALVRNINTAESIFWYFLATSQRQDVQTARDLHKREWSLGVNGYYSGGGNWGVGGTLRYTWGRR